LKPAGESVVEPVIVLSKCLEHEACRYNAQIIRDDFVRELTPFVRWLTVCPEVEIGLGTPRDPIRLVRIENRTRLFQPSTDRDLTDEMDSFAERFLEQLPPVDGFLLKNRSPSCGIKGVKVYDPSGAASHGKQAGSFATHVLERFDGLAVEDEGRLRDPGIRHHFLSRLFALARFRQRVEKGGMGSLVAYHAAHKLLFMAHNQAGMRALGRIVANAERAPVASVIASYRAGLGRVLARQARPGSVVNVAQHAFGYVSGGLGSREKLFFDDLLSDYRAKRKPLAALTAVLAAWIERFEVDYLADQVFFAPYPAPLLTVNG
jgi:uncharacterized protein YbgA (DUF1722 family)/uncharacterized protein YbbK (DUF523 family)